eukprot:g17573.t1
MAKATTATCGRVIHSLFQSYEYSVEVEAAPAPDMELRQIHIEMQAQPGPLLEQVRSAIAKEGGTPIRWAITEARKDGDIRHLVIEGCVYDGVPGVEGA